MGLGTSYRSTYAIFATYWNAYGGWRSFLCSPYMHVALLITLCITGFVYNREWWTIALQTIPNILGFSLGGYAIWLGFGEEKFKALVAGRSADEDPRLTSPYMEVSATFCHFIVLQVLAVGISLVAWALAFDAREHFFSAQIASWFGPSWPDALFAMRMGGAALGVFVCAYSLTAALAAALAVFRVSAWYDKFQTQQKKTAT